MMINRFIDEVVSQGAEAVLPQNLEMEWLDMIYVAAKNFLHTALTMKENLPEEEVLNDESSMMLLSAVVEIVQHQNGYKQSGEPFEIPEEQIFECISCYAIAIVLESIARESDVEFTPPNTANIFERERLFDVEQENPELTELLNKLIIEE
ncbi:MAG: hypothetical protein WC799_19920 [Desulfobacteraceae bacterium]|jgi:hypothetical protein